MNNKNILLEYIRIQWTDIHHCRNQTWQALVIIAGIYAALGQLNNALNDFIPLIALAGAIISALAATISKQHRIIMLQKISIITELESQLDLPLYRIRKTIIPVQMIMFIIFAISCVVFAFIFIKNFRPIEWDNRYIGVIIVIIGFVIYYFYPSTKVKHPTDENNIQVQVPFLVIRKRESELDWKLNLEPMKKNNGRKICVNKICNSKEYHAKSPEWKPRPEDEKTAVVETGYGGIEVATFSEKAYQNRHKHLISTETYTVLKGSMDIRFEEEIITLEVGDEIIIFPNTVHEVLNYKSMFLTRLHSMNCHGDKDKYLEVNGKWLNAIQYKKIKSVKRNLN